MSYNDLIADYIIKQGIELTSEFNYTISLDDLEKVKAIAKEQDRSINYVIAGIVAKSLRGIK